MSITKMTIPAALPSLRRVAAPIWASPLEPAWLPKRGRLADCAGECLMGEGEGTLAMASLEAAELLTAKRFTVYDFQHRRLLLHECI